MNTSSLYWRLDNWKSNNVHEEYRSLLTVFQIHLEFTEEKVVPGFPKSSAPGLYKSALGFFYFTFLQVLQELSWPLLGFSGFLKTSETLAFFISTCWPERTNSELCHQFSNLSSVPSISVRRNLKKQDSEPLTICWTKWKDKQKIR